MNNASPVTAMQQLAASALIGTDRSGGGGGGPAMLLSQAALLGAQASAGYWPRTVTARLQPCPPDPRAVASPKQMASLLQLLAGPDAALIDEWAMLGQAAGVRVTDASAPALLDWWARQPRRSEVVFSVLGIRGEWLAGLNPLWRKPVAGAEVPKNADELWQTGSTPQRLALLVTLRRHDPEAARELVQSTWQSDGADERRRFIEALGNHVSRADEPFLEASLDDKSKVVRRQTAAVLALLPSSSLRSRMNDRARRMIKVEAKRGAGRRGVKVTLVPPAEFDKAWERDGVEEQVGAGKGKRAWWMRQVLAAADVSVWTEVSGLGPEAVIEAIGSDDFFSDASGALVQSACATKDPQWCAALVRSLLGRDKPDLDELALLLKAVAQAQSESLMLEAVGRERMRTTDRWLLLASLDRPWSEAFSKAAMKLLSKLRPKKADDVWSLYSTVEAMSRWISPSAADDFEETIAGMFSDQPTDSFRKSIDRVRLRAEMHKEFAS